MPQVFEIRMALPVTIWQDPIPVSIRRWSSYQSINCTKLKLWSHREKPEEKAQQ